MKFLKTTYGIPILILLAGILLFVPFSGALHLFDWDEIIFAESAREMLVSGDYLTVTINYKPFYEKPPLFIWMQALSMKAFGINEFAARFPNAVAAIVTLISLFFVGRKIHDERFGLLWSISYATAILPFFYFQTGLIDPWFNYFIFMGFAFFVFSLNPDCAHKRIRNSLLSGISLGLAILTKGPVAFLIFALVFCVFYLYRRGKIQMLRSNWLYFGGAVLLTGTSWFLLAIARGNFEVVADFIRYQAGLFAEDFGGHRGFPGFHFVVLLFGVFPASVFALGGITRKREDEKMARDFRNWMTILIAVVLVLFSIVKTKLVHYSSLAYFPITYLAAWNLFMWLKKKREIWRWQLILLGLLSFIIVLASAGTVFVMSQPELLRNSLHFIGDHYAREVVMDHVNWRLWDYLPAVVLLSGTIYSLRSLLKRDIRGLIGIHITVLLFSILSLWLLAPKVEEMVQGPAIAFLEAHSTEDEYTATFGYKSYAHFFYGKRMPGELDEAQKKRWFTDQLVDKPLYIVMKADNYTEVLQRFPNLKLIGQEGGYVFGVYLPR